VIGRLGEPQDIANAVHFSPVRFPASRSARTCMSMAGSCNTLPSDALTQRIFPFTGSWLIVRPHDG